METNPQWFKTYEVTHETVDGNIKSLKEPIPIPVYIVKDLAEWENMPQYLKFMAEYGMVVHVPSQLFASLARTTA